MKKINLDAMGWMVALIILLSSCYNIQKAEQQTNRALITYPAVVANIARTSFPCYVIRTENKKDSTDFKKWRDSVYTLNAFYNDLFNHIEPTLIHDTTNNCTAYKDNEIKFRQKISYQEKLIAELNSKIDDIKPIKDSTKNWFEDSANIKIMQTSLNVQGNTIIKLQATITEDERKISTKNKWIIGLGISILLSILGFVFKTIVKFK